MTSINYYDAVMVILPALLLLGRLSEMAFHISARIGILIAASIDAAILLHALFINPPINPEVSND